MTQTPAKKTAAKKAPAKKTVAPAVVASIPQYVALRKMTANGVDYNIGDVIPDAHTWLRLESRIRARWIKEA